MKHLKLLLFFIVISVTTLNAQTGFYFKNDKKSHVKVPFRLISNLIVLEVKLNDIPMSFVLDTGANNTFLFNLSENETAKFKNIKRIPINGLGSSKSIEAIVSTDNKIEIGGLVNKEETIHLLLDEEINFSKQLGIPIDGIIGCDLLKNFITKINYSNKIIRFYKPETYKRSKLKKYQETDIIRYKKRLYVNAVTSIENAEVIPVKLLIDTGSSDGVWLFENATKGLRVPKQKFRDYMGAGIGGDIHGERARLNKFKLANYEFSEVKVAFPDSLDIALAYLNENRHGSLGSGIIKRFHIIIDYKGSKMYLKKNQFFKDPFEYNMSGIEIEHSGLRIEKVFNDIVDFSDEKENSRNTFSAVSLYKTSLVPAFEIVEIRQGSPAEKAGVKEGDILLKIDSKRTYKYKLAEIIELLSEKEGKRLTIEVDRKGRIMKFEFQLKRLL